MKSFKNTMGGFFTVEAALVMPVVLLCYAAVIVLLCYIYERCIWEQNACRLPVWEAYVEGFVCINSQVEEQIGKEDICQYILDCMNEEEAQKYLLGHDISAKISIRGDHFKVVRNVTYPRMADKCYEYAVEVLSFEPVSYLRITHQLKSTVENMVNEEGENDAQE